MMVIPNGSAPPSKPNNFHFNCGSNSIVQYPSSMSMVSSPPPPAENMYHTQQPAYNFSQAMEATNGFFTRQLSENSSYHFMAAAAASRQQQQQQQAASFQSNDEYSSYVQHGHMPQLGNNNVSPTEKSLFEEPPVHHLPVSTTAQGNSHPIIGDSSSSGGPLANERNFSATMDKGKALADSCGCSSSSRSSSMTPTSDDDDDVEEHGHESGDSSSRPDFLTQQQISTPWIHSGEKQFEKEYSHLSINIFPFS